MRIRDACADDLEYVQRLMSTYFLDMDDLSIEDFIVAQIGDRIVGCAAAIDRTCPEIHSIAVHPNYRGKGIGSKMAMHIISSAPAEWGTIYVRTTVPVFFEKLGFSRLPDSEKSKLWDDCATCSRFENCRQSVMGLRVKRSGE